MDATIGQDIRAGIQLYLKQDYAGAEGQLSQALQMNPTWAEGWSYLGFSQYMQQKYLEAGQSLEKAVIMDSENAEARFGLGLVWAAQKRVDAAIACWDEVLRLKPGHADAKRSLVGGLLYRATQHIADKDYDHAEHDMERAIKVDRSAPQAVVALVNHFVSINMIARAEKTLKEALPYAGQDSAVQALAAQLNVQASTDATTAAQDMQARQQVQKTQEVPCPNCKRPVMEWAAICPHCNHQIKAIPSLFATRQATTKAYNWQDVMYYIVTILWVGLSVVPLLIVAAAFGMSSAFSGVAGVPLLFVAARVVLGIGLMFQNDFAMTYAKWLSMLGILKNLLWLMIDWYARRYISFGLGILAIGIDSFMIYLLNYMGAD